MPQISKIFRNPKVSNTGCKKEHGWEVRSTEGPERDLTIYVFPIYHFSRRIFCIGQHSHCG